MEDSVEKGGGEESVQSERKSAAHHAKRAYHHAKKGASFIQNHAVLFALFAVLILQFVPNGQGTYPWGGMYMRMLTRDLPFADNAAQSSVDNYLTQQAATAAAQQYPNLPDANRQKVIADLVTKLRAQAGGQIEEQRLKLAQQIRDHYQYEENGVRYNYMPDIDPYFYLRYARNIVETGHSYDTLKDGVPWDTHMVAPLGIKADPSWHQYILASIYWGGRLIDNKLSLMQAAFYFPIIFMFLSLILAFLIANKVSGPMGGFFAALILGVMPAISGRTLFGHPDTDTYQVFFPLLVIWLLTEALSRKDKKWQAILGGLIGLSLAVYSKFWSGWWYLFDFVLGALVAAFVVELVMHARKHHVKTAHHNEHLKKFAVVIGSILLVSIVAGTILVGFSDFMNAAFGAALNFTNIKEASLPSLWPNVYTTVAELNPGSTDAVINAVGGSLLFALGILGIILLLFRVDEESKRDAAYVTYAVLLALWFAGTMYASVKGLRFILLIGPAFAVAFGVSAGLLFRRVSSFAEKQLNVSKTVTAAVLLLLFGFAIMGPSASGPHMVKNVYAEAVQDLPIVNDAWANVLTKIRNESKPNAIINSWWDFGHQFKYLADRATTSDGAVQNSPQAHWVGKLLQTSDENEAIAILRMLDCGGNSAQDDILNATKDPYKSVMLTKKIIMMDHDSAEAFVKANGLPADLLQYTHCAPPEDFLITSADMTGKAGVWAHFGLWDFAKAEVWQKWRLLPEEEAVPKMAERFNWTEDEAQTIYRDANGLASEDAANQWISPWPGYMTDPAACTRDGAKLTCGNLVLDAKEKKAEVRVPQGVASAGWIYSFEKNGSVTTDHFEGGSQSVAVILWPTADGVNGMAVTNDLAKSVYTRLFYMDGLGLKHFDKFAEDNQLFGGKIIVWNVSWQGHAAFVPEDLKPKTSIMSGAHVKLDYIGYTDNNQVFDSSIVDWRNNNVTPDSSLLHGLTKPLDIVFGKGQLISGFEKRIEGMKANESRTIRIPPEEAYGTDPTKHPLGNQTLNFKVRVVNVQ